MHVYQPPVGVGVMRYLSVLMSLLCLSTAADAQSYAVRPVDPVAAVTFARAVARSEVVRALVATLESSNVIVHVQTSATLPSGFGGTMRFVANRGGYRYLRVTIGTHLSDDARIAIFAHELKHACEVAESDAADV